MVSFERFHQNCQAVLAAVSINGLIPSTLSHLVTTRRFSPVLLHAFS